MCCLTVGLCSRAHHRVAESFKTFPMPWQRHSEQCSLHVSLRELPTCAYWTTRVKPILQWYSIKRSKIAFTAACGVGSVGFARMLTISGSPLEGWGGDHGLCRNFGEKYTKFFQQPTCISKSARPSSAVRLSSSGNGGQKTVLRLPSCPPTILYIWSACTVKIYSVRGSSPRTRLQSKPSGHFMSAPLPQDLLVGGVWRGLTILLSSKMRRHIALSTVIDKLLQGDDGGWPCPPSIVSQCRQDLDWTHKWLS